jgi:hypothetical protein
MNSITSIQAKMGVQMKFIARAVTVNFTLEKLFRISFRGASQKSPNSMKIRKGEIKTFAIWDMKLEVCRISPNATAVRSNSGSILSKNFMEYLFYVENFPKLLFFSHRNF